MKKAIALVISSIVFCSIAAAHDHHKDIVDTAASSKDFKTLVTAVKSAGLVEALKGKGPFTVFAPTEKAFQKLEKSKPGTIKMLLMPENKKMLQDILKYHVVSGKVMAADVVKLESGTMVPTLMKGKDKKDKKIKITIKDGVMINNSKVIKTDIVCKNGVIHVIDTVLLPN
jgi:uncharacterized surface protein with fasciclin (FAS1) repeats